MPHVADGEGLDLPFLDLDAIVELQGEPPWRTCLVGTAGLRVVLLCWPPGFATVPHHHPWAEEVFLVLRGRAAMTIDPEPEREFGPGTFLLAKRGVRHAIRVPDGGEPLLLLAAVGPNEDRRDETIELG
jgi:mannose-6-phosphate isomerase-like protein (cupin superfamily)